MLDREKILEDFKIDKKNKKGKIVKGNISDGTLNCLEMGMAFLRNEKDLTNFTPVMLADFIEEIMSLWKPEGDDKGEKRKKETLLELQKLLPFLQKNITKYVKAKKSAGKPTYEKAKPIFEEWEKHINKKIFGNIDLKLANPFLTVSIADNLEDGITFQKDQVRTRRAVTEWGGIFEDALAIFNPKVKKFNAGRMDCSLDTTVYDVKSGPNVLNQRDVDGYNKKISKISKLKKKSFGKFIGITDHKVAIIYGHWELRNSYMKQIKKEGIIIGPATWETFTSDDWHAFIFFMWQIRYGIEELKKIWYYADLQKAVEIFLNSFYGDEKLLEQKRVKLEKDVGNKRKRIKKIEELIVRLTGNEEPDEERIANRKADVKILKSKLPELERSAQETKALIAKRKEYTAKAEEDPEFKIVEKLTSKN